MYSNYPLMSVIIPCYKNFETLFPMIDSVLEQDYPNIELIISDDGSDEFDIDLIKKYIDMDGHRNLSDVVVRKNEANVGTVKHVKMLLDMTKGDYVVLIAADDRFVGRNVLSMYMDCFSKTDAYWIVAKCSITNANYSKELYIAPTKEDIPFYKEENAIRLFSRWSRRGMAIPCCMAFRREAFSLVGGIDTDYKYSEDWPLFLKLLRNGYAPKFIDRVTAVHSSGGITNSNQRYGKEVRAAFYEDKYLMMQKEVYPFIHLLTKEDRKCLRQYKHEIMDRKYFFDVDLPETSFFERLVLIIKKPIYGWWLFESFFMRKIYPHWMRYVLFASIVCLFLSTNLFGVHIGIQGIDNMFYWLGVVSFGLFWLLFVGFFVLFSLKKFFRYKYWLRKRLVN